MLFDNARGGDDLLVEGGDVHVEPPSDPGEDMRAGGQSRGQAIDGWYFLSLNHAADMALGVDPVQVAIFVTEVLSPVLMLGP